MRSVELKSVTLAPGERADLVFDFAGNPGENIILQDGVVSVIQFRAAREKSLRDMPFPPDCVLSRECRNRPR
jgi:hypothetical protein